MIFDFLKKLFGWAHEGAKKRKASEVCSFEEEHSPAKKYKTNCNTSHWVEDYSDIDDSENDDIVFLSERKFSTINSCAKLNGTHKREPPPYQFHTMASPNVCKSACSPLCRDNSTVPCYSDRRHRMEDSSHKYLTLCRTNQMKERHQYEELLQNFLPSKIQILKDKRVEQIPVEKVVEVIELDKEESTTDKMQFTTKVSQETPSRWRNRSILSNISRTDRGKVPIFLDRNEKDNATCSRKSIPARIEKLDASAAKSPFMSTIKPIATNSLRDELAAKAVMRQDFIPQVTKRYNERINQRHREAEELKRMTCVLSKQNRYAREAALEEQLARSMKLCLAVLDDREEPEEPPLPRLTDQIRQEVKNALVPCPPDEILVEDFGLRITRKDIHTLSGLNWLNDEVINFYMNLLIARGTTDNYPKVYAMNTFFYPKLLSGGHSSLKRWTRKVDLFAQDLVVVPIHLDIHWCMSIIDLRDKAIVYYDSMGSSNPKCLAALKQYLQDESLDKKKKAYDMSDWKLKSAKDIPQQMNGSDCGVFSCMFAEYVCANKKITFTQQDMPYFRNKMVYEILKSKLL